MKTLKRTIYELKAMFLTMFGNIKMFKWPMFLIYDPTFHQMTGEHTNLLNFTWNILQDRPMYYMLATKHVSINFKRLNHTKYLL